MITFECLAYPIVLLNNEDIDLLSFWMSTDRSELHLRPEANSARSARFAIEVIA